MTNQPPSLSDHHKFTSLHRYYAWSTVLREQFRSRFSEIVRSENIEVTLREWMGPAGFGRGTVFMSYWYVSLYVVIEGWLELGYSDPVIDELIRSEHTGRLKRHRNATCHYQKPILADKWSEFEQASGSVEWLIKLDEEFSRYFLDRTRTKMGEFLEHYVPIEHKCLVADPAMIELIRKEVQRAGDRKDDVAGTFWRAMLDMLEG